MGKKVTASDPAKAMALAQLKKGKWTTDQLDMVATAMHAWYDTNRRDLPWRAKIGRRPNPYHVWLSEIMLQQTTVATVRAYFHHFITTWPTLIDLANAPQAQILTAWAGLGYYARARNLHACAKRIRDRNAGAFPQTETALRQLPGIGPYSAAAIASIAFGQRAVVVDGNVERVVSRVFRLETPMPAAKKPIWHLADRLTPSDRAGDYAQALMDLGAGLCGRGKPTCQPCPLRGICRGQDLAETLPRKAAKKSKPRRFAKLVAICDPTGAYLLLKRPEAGLLGGMLVFPGTDWSHRQNTGRPGWPDWEQELVIPSQQRRLEKIGEIRHEFTHFQLNIRFFHLAISAQERQIYPSDSRHHWIQPKDFHAHPLPSVMRKLAKFLATTNK